MGLLATTTHSETAARHLVALVIEASLSLALGYDYGRAHPSWQYNMIYVPDDRAVFRDFITVDPELSPHSVLSMRNELAGPVGTFTDPATGEQVSGGDVVRTVVEAAAGAGATAASMFLGVGEWELGGAAANQLVKRLAPVLQSTGKKILPRTGKALNELFGTGLHPKERGDALEALKRKNGIPNDFHSLEARADGGVYLGERPGQNDAGKLIEFIIDYVRKGKEVYSYLWILLTSSASIPTVRILVPISTSRAHL
jgi:hypothetical protein